MNANDELDKLFLSSNKWMKYVNTYKDGKQIAQSMVPTDPSVNFIGDQGYNSIILQLPDNVDPGGWELMDQEIFDSIRDQFENGMDISGLIDAATGVILDSLLNNLDLDTLFSSINQLMQLCQSKNTVQQNSFLNDAVNNTLPTALSNNPLGKIGNDCLSGIMQNLTSKIPDLSILMDSLGNIDLSILTTAYVQLQDSFSILMNEMSSINIQEQLSYITGMFKNIFDAQGWVGLAKDELSNVLQGLDTVLPNIVNVYQTLSNNVSGLAKQLPVLDALQLHSDFINKTLEKLNAIRPEDIIGIPDEDKLTVAVRVASLQALEDIYGMPLSMDIPEYIATVYSIDHPDITNTLNTAVNGTLDAIDNLDKYIPIVNIPESIISTTTPDVDQITESSTSVTTNISIVLDQAILHQIDDLLVFPLDVEVPLGDKRLSSIKEQNIHRWIDQPPTTSIGIPTKKLYQLFILTYILGSYYLPVPLDTISTQNSFFSQLRDIIDFYGIDILDEISTELASNGYTETIRYFFESHRQDISLFIGDMSTDPQLQDEFQKLKLYSDRYQQGFSYRSYPKLLDMVSIASYLTQAIVQQISMMRNLYDDITILTMDYLYLNYNPSDVDTFLLT